MARADAGAAGRRRPQPSGSPRRTGSAVHRAFHSIRPVGAGWAVGRPLPAPTWLGAAPPPGNQRPHVYCGDGGPRAGHIVTARLVCTLVERPFNREGVLARYGTRAQERLRLECAEPTRTHCTNVPGTSTSAVSGEGTQEGQIGRITEAPCCERLDRARLQHEQALALPIHGAVVLRKRNPRFSSEIVRRGSRRAVRGRPRAAR